MKHIIAYCSLILIGTTAFGQTPFGDNIHWLSGYEKSISGETISYFSAFPDYVNEALLTRTTDGKKTIEWLTDVVPENATGQYVYFRWVAAHSTGSSSGTRHFDFYINNKKALVITTLQGNNTPVWSFASDDSTKIVFTQLRSDGARDAHGIIYLRVPVSIVQPGKPLDLKLVGEAEQSNDWFMTFKYAFEEKADVFAYPFLLKNGKQPLSITVLHFGNKSTLHVSINNKENYSFPLTDGMNNFEAPFTITKNDSLHVLAQYDTTVLVNKNIPVTPIIQREIDLIHHSHTDIGYSALQTDVEKIHIKDIYDALHMIDKTKNYPQDAKFKWNVESLWAVENFLRQASHEDSTRFFTAVRNGSICLSGMYANMLTGLSMPEELFHYNDYAVMLRNKFHLPIESGMITDVPGLTWATVTALAKNGIRYMSDGPNYLGKNNPYLGDRVGHFVKAWGDRPVWWLSPSGKEKILLWTAGKGYSSWHGTPTGGVFFSGTKKIADYLNELAAEKYPYDIVQWRYNIVADNGPIDTTISDFVKQWNEKYASPKLVLSTVNNTFERFEKKYGANIPVVKGDITPYWEDGAASTAYEEGVNRDNSLRCQQLTTLYAMLAPSKYNAADFYSTWRNIIMFTEHTWGAFNSISEPDIDFVKEQWRIKKDFMLDADKKLNDISNNFHVAVADNTSDKIAVANTLSWKRDGLVYVPGNSNANSVTDAKGNIYPLQTLPDGRKMFFAKDIAPLSVAYYYLKNETNLPGNKNPFTITDSSASNGIITIVWNKNDGSIIQLIKDGYNYADEFKQQGLNAYWYVPGRDPADAESNNQVTVNVETNGNYFSTISFTSTAPGTNGIIRKISLLANSDLILIENTVDKKSVRTKEAVYFAFPFNHDLNQASVDAGYGTMHYLKDQLPGSNMDYLSTRRWLDVSGDNKGIQLMMKEAFLAAPDSMVDERFVINQSHKRWRDEGKPTSQWFSYVMNNYWHTNYKADQEGKSVFQYALRPHEKLNNVEQEKAAMEFTQPLFAFRVNENKILPANLFELSNDKIIVTSITPQDNGGFLIRLFNPSATDAATMFNWHSLQPKSIIEMPSKVPIKIYNSINIHAYDVVDLMVK